MKAILEFTLPEEDHLFAVARQGADWAGAVEDFREWLRGQRKYTTLPPQVREWLDEAWDQLHFVLRDRGLELG